MAGVGVDVGGGDEDLSPDAFPTAELISSWHFARFLFVSGAAGTVVIRLQLSSVRDTKSIVAFASDMSTMDDDGLDRLSLLAIGLPATLCSLIGGVCNRMMFGGRIGAVAVTLLL